MEPALVDRLLRELRAAGGVADPATLLVRAGVFQDPPPGTIANRVIAEAFRGDVRVSVSPGMVRLERIHPAPTFAVVELGTDTLGPPPPVVYEVACVKVVGAGCDQVCEPFREQVRPREELSEELVLRTGLDPAAIATAPPLEAVAPVLQRYLDGCILVTHRGGEREVERAVGAPVWEARLEIAALAKRLVDGLRSSRLEVICAALEVDPPRPLHSALARATSLAHLLVELTRLAKDRDYAPADLCELSRTPHRQVLDFSRYAFTRETLDETPEAPGIYRFYDADDQLLYVGASENLHRRLTGHFAPRASPHSRRLRAHVHDLKWEVYGSALEAFLREAELIRDLAPPLNRRGTGLRDACYLRIMRRGGVPRLVAGRRPVKKGRSFGPFVFPGGVRDSVATIEAAFRTAPERLEGFLSTGDLGLAPERCPEVVAVARARAELRGDWYAATRAVLLPGGSIALVGGGTVGILVAEGTPEAVAARLQSLANTRAEIPDHLVPEEAALAQLIRKHALGHPEVRLDTLADLDAVREAIAELVETGGART